MTRPHLDILALVIAFKSGTSFQELLAEQYGLTVPEVEGIVRVFLHLSEQHRLEIKEVDGIMQIFVRC